ncbi:hypothetical protein ACFYZJ_37950 [Streptomyces sp. NPDC001848]
MWLTGRQLGSRVRQRIFRTYQDPYDDPLPKERVTASHRYR